MKGWDVVLKRIKDVSKETEVNRNFPKIGRMYAYSYDPKTKERLPYYDIVPLVIPVSYTKNGFYGLNFHYLSLAYRNELLKLILPFEQASKDNLKLRANYKKLYGLSSGIWSGCCKRYLWNHIKSKFAVIPYSDWYEVIKLPVVSFYGAKNSYVFRRTMTGRKKKK